MHTSMVGFVDDSTGSCNDFQPSTQAPLPTLLQLMEKDAQTWNNLLHSSGGKLELPKCSFHVLHFEFKPDGRPVPLIDRFDNTIHITDLETTSAIPNPSKRAFEPHKTLGHYKSPVTNAWSNIKSLQDKANKLALLLSLSPISRQGALLAYHTVYIPTVKYTLPQSFYPRKLMDQVQAQSVSKLAAKCGLNRNTSRSLLFAPTAYAGAGFIPWYVLQGEGQIQHVLKHWRTNTIVSATLRIAIQWAQWQSGHEVSIFEDTSTPLPHLECRWLLSTRQFMDTIQATLHFDIPLAASRETQQDLFIMKLARECRLFSENDLKIINYCRLYLHVTTVSEMFNVEGTQILPHIWQCFREPWFNPSTYITIQQRPSKYQVRTKWQRLCRQISTEDGKIAASISLGKRAIPGNQLRRRRQSYIAFHDTGNVIYHWREGMYHQYIQTDTQNIFIPAQESPKWEPISACAPVDVYDLQDPEILVPKYQHKTHFPRQNRVQTSFEQYIYSLHDWEQALLEGITFILAPYEIQHYISTLDTTHQLMIVSDGSQQDSQLSFGWVFGTDQGQIFTEHASLGYGTPSSHRAEAWAMLSGTLFLHHLYKYLNIPTHNPPFNKEVTFFSDNSGLILRMKQRHQYRVSYPNSMLPHDWDLIEQIYSLACNLPHTKVSYSWVRGHQDPTSDNLSSTEAIYNIRADYLASTIQAPANHITDPQWMLPAERCRLKLQGTSRTLFNGNLPCLCLPSVPDISLQRTWMAIF